ncbi:Polyprenyl synthetase [Chloroherpeton thalassium ATCC 35110]|uniref:Polyprenyl synthetase n=1 Tax=Chloroherpeton thalassium (strain ATCC 35110 / GB-78) TaxID=517418 RepID=B3QX31_CHLT3|nr:polyprenyl synthetase family protein [Chloroherpeton thalassium]ACF14841.1 Polyprenyl synthetase [Chloroherpeton thalassium ATCC 35110]
MNINEVIRPVKSELELFRTKFKDAMASEVGLLNKVASYILKQKGKQIRPALVLLSAKLVGGVNEGTYRAAALVELLHTATLVHDDVVDTADMRRGLPAVNALWKNKVAVLMGDYLLARGLLLALQNGDTLFLNIVSDAVRRMSEGELLQIEKTRHLDIDEETYFKIISDKTASLISTACELGAASASTDEKVRQSLRDCGEALGLAFQIRDDILDYQGDTKNTGKPIGGDIKEKKITLPLIYSLNKVGEEKRKEIISILKSDKKRALFSNDIINFVVENGGIEYADKVAKDYANKALEAIQDLPDCESKKSIDLLVEFVIKRKV